MRISRLICVFAKRPEPGKVKTRMCPPLSPEQAALLYAAMLADVLEATARAATGMDAALWLTVHPAEAVKVVAETCPAGFRVVAQQGPDLAARMAHAVAAAAAAGHDRILLRGSDSPAIPASALEQALRALDEVDLAVAPDRDGGYSLIGLRTPVAGLFDHPMSTGSVLEDTLANARSAGLTVECLAPRFDLDSIDDLAALAEARRSGAAPSCRRTLAYLDANDLWRRAPTA